MYTFVQKKNPDRHRIKIGNKWFRGSYTKDQAEHRADKIIIFMEEEGLISVGQYPLNNKNKWPEVKERIRHAAQYSDNPSWSYLGDEDRDYIWSHFTDAYSFQRTHYYRKIANPEKVETNFPLLPGEEIRPEGKYYRLYFEGKPTKRYFTLDRAERSVEAERKSRESGENE